MRPGLRKHFRSLSGVSRYRLVSSYAIAGSLTNNKRRLADATSYIARCTESAVCVVNADADDFSVFGGVANPHRLAADKTVLDVILRRYGQIKHQRDAFTAIRTVDRSFFNQVQSAAVSEAGIARNCLCVCGFRQKRQRPMRFLMPVLPEY
jgi:hypothetical protein